MSERLTQRNEQGIATFKRPVLCERCDEPSWSICDEGGENITNRLCELEDILYDGSGKEVISLEDLNKIAEANELGCYFCNEEEKEHGFSIEGGDLYYDDSMYGSEGIEINYCPICGRKLPERPEIAVLLDAATRAALAEKGAEHENA